MLNSKHWNKFMEWMNKDNPGDARVIFGCELICLFSAIIYKFTDSSWFEVLYIELPWLCYIINSLLFIGIALGIVLLVSGLVAKLTHKNK